MAPLTPLPFRGALPGPGPLPALPLPRGLRGASLRARPGRLRRPRMRQRRHVPGGRRRAALLMRVGLRRPRLSGTRRPLRRAALRPRRPLLRALLRPGLRMRARLHGRALRVSGPPRRRGRCRRRRRTAGSCGRRRAALPGGAGCGLAGGRGLGRRRVLLAGASATPRPWRGPRISLVAGDPRTVGAHAPRRAQQQEDAGRFRGRPKVRGGAGPRLSLFLIGPSSLLAFSDWLFLGGGRGINDPEFRAWIFVLLQQLQAISRLESPR